MEKGYKLKYNGKWMEDVHCLGRYIYILKDDPSSVKVYPKSIVYAIRRAISEDNNIDKELIEVVEVEDPPPINKRKKTSEET